MKQFYRRILVCVIPVLLAAIIVGMATNQYLKGEGGFKLGVDLVGGTILVYEVDQDKQLAAEDARGGKKSSTGEELAAALKRRIDPTDLYNVIIRPISDTRVEIILPTGGKHQSDIDEARWQELLTAVRGKWPELEGVNLDVGRGQHRELALLIQQAIERKHWQQLIATVRAKWPDKLKDVKLDAIYPGQIAELRDDLKKAGLNEEKDIKPVLDKAFQDYQSSLVKADAIVEFVDAHYKLEGKRRDFTGEQVDQVKQLVQHVGSLEFRILANGQDDKEAIDAAKAYLDVAGDPKAPEDVRVERKRDLEARAMRGLAPPPPKAADGNTSFKWSNQWGSGDTSYSWVELGPEERKHLNLDNAAADAKSGRSQRWNEVAAARKEGKVIVLNDGDTSVVLYSRPCTNFKLAPAEQARKQYEYFVLTRDARPGEKITGQNLANAQVGTDRGGVGLAVHFRFDTTGGNRFYDTTSMNKPSGGEGTRFYRRLAIILDDLIVSAPRLNEAIRTEGQISGNFTKDQVDRLVTILRSGALPTTLKPLPVSENTIGPTLGADTISSGIWSVFWSFVVVMIFMVIYYRFAGLVACVALLANLLLTIGFMVMVQATFTLPGLAGLVLMLAMAVDANVLIYERLREERDRGASLALAIRNGYDRAFPTIIDTHLTSIFTAIVLYVVGNDQLKGFGISLTVGLIISLFTSLYMTRLLFDIWFAMGWLKKLSMARLLSNPKIDFMRIRYYWFTATLVLTLFGITVFLVRGQQGLNIDFTGGTLYGGQLIEPLDVSQLRKLLDKENQDKQLHVVDVQQSDENGLHYKIFYQDGNDKTERTIALTNVPLGKDASRKEREQDVLHRASTLADWSVEQIFLASDTNEGNKSRYFNVRTSEKSPDLVQVTVDRLLRADKDGKEVSLLKKIEMKDPTVKGHSATLEFTADASPGQVKSLLDREAYQFGVPLDKITFDLIGTGASKEGRYLKMKLEVSGPGSEKIITEDKLRAILVKTQEEFAARPQPERLENFDAALAADTQLRALYAILASWGAILLYLWFRFGNWTFGLATVLCLMHDLFFTLGIIAFCHYIVVWTPWLASLLLLEDFKIDLQSVAALLTLVGYSVSDTIVVFDRIREVRGKNPELTPQMINDSVNQTLSRTLLTAFSVWLVVSVLYIWGGEGVHLFAFVMVVGVVVGTYSSIYIASPLLLMFGEGQQAGARRPTPEPEPEPEEEDEEAAASEQITTSPGGREAPDERIQDKEE